MTTEEAIHRAALRKHRHKGNYIATHEALLAEAEYLQQTARQVRAAREPLIFAFIVLVSSGLSVAIVMAGVVVWQVIRGWFA